MTEKQSLTKQDIIDIFLDDLKNEGPITAYLNEYFDQRYAPHRFISKGPDIHFCTTT